MRAMLLAAGVGARLRPVTNAQPKPSVPFLNVPLLYWNYQFLRELDPDRLVINLHYLPDQLRETAKAIEQKGVAVAYSHEEKGLLGSGGALWFAKKHLEGTETFVVANADEVIFPLNSTALNRLREKHERAGALATLLTMEHPGVGTHFGGVYVDENDLIIGFSKKPQAFPQAKRALHYVGVLMLDRRIFKYLPEGESNLLYDAVAAGIAQGEKAQVLCEQMLWFETGNPTDFLTATAEMLPLLSPMIEPSHPSTLVQNVLREWHEGPLRFWESDQGARMLYSELANGSLTHTELCTALEHEASANRKAFAVIGAKALIKAPVINSIVLPTATVAAPARDTFVI